jgi:hypothetical protein
MAGDPAGRVVAIIGPVAPAARGGSGVVFTCLAHMADHRARTGGAEPDAAPNGPWLDLRGAWGVSPTGHAGSPNVVVHLSVSAQSWDDIWARAAAHVDRRCRPDQRKLRSLETSSSADTCCRRVGDSYSRLSAGRDRSSGRSRRSPRVCRESPRWPSAGNVIAASIRRRSSTASH